MSPAILAVEALAESQIFLLPDFVPNHRGAPADRATRRSRLEFSSDGFAVLASHDSPSDSPLAFSAAWVSSRMWLTLTSLRRSPVSWGGEWMALLSWGVLFRVVLFRVVILGVVILGVVIFGVGL